MQGNIAGAYLLRVLYHVIDMLISGWSKPCLLHKTVVTLCKHTHLNFFTIFLCFSSNILKKNYLVWGGSVINGAANLVSHAIHTKMLSKSTNM